VEGVTIEFEKGIHTSLPVLSQSRVTHSAHYLTSVLRMHPTMRQFVGQDDIVSVVRIVAECLDDL
jgi:hypothetical protein